MNEIDKEAKTTAVVEPISQILEEIEAKASMNSSLANSVVVIDMGNLLAFDPRPVDSHLMKKDVESYLLDHCTRTTQLIVNNLFKLPTENVDDILVAKLPKPSIVIPREKPLPKQKPLTKWEQYAKMKGIQKKKKGRKVYDEVAKEWRPMWGYNRAKETTKEWLIEIPKNQDPNQDFFAKKTQEKTERVAKNELQRLRNIARSSKKKVPGIGMTPTDKNPPDEKLRIKKSLHMAKTADASMSKFSQKLKDEDKTTRGFGKKRKFESNYGSIKTEKERQIKLFEKLTSNKDKSNKEKLNIEKAANRHIAAEDNNDESRKKQKTNKRRSSAGKHRRVGGKGKSRGAPMRGGKRK